MIIKGKTVKYGDNIDTDVIIPARYLNTTDKAELALHCMEDLDSDFAEKCKGRKIIVAGENFGSGSSREHAPAAIKASGIELVVAKSFARIFFRNSINIGLAIVESPEAVALIDDGDEISVDLTEGVITLPSHSKKIVIEPFPKFIQSIIDRGGLLK